MVADDRAHGDICSFADANRAAKNRGGIRSVTFGEIGSWFVVYDDGMWHYMNVPTGLKNKLEARDKRSDLKFVSLGPDGEWCLAAENGRMWWNQGTGESKLLENVDSISGRITYMTFGEGTYFVRYE